MTDDEQKPGDQKATKVPSREVTVPDATHTRFRKPMCRCSDEGHGTFALNKLHEHFKNFNHRSVDSCVLCNSNEVYEYHFTMDRHAMKIYHNCSPSKTRETTSVPPDQKNNRESNTAQPISQSPEVSDAESSGIGTGYSSMVSVFNGHNEDGKSTGGSPNKSSHSLSESSQVKGSSPSSSVRSSK